MNYPRVFVDGPLRFVTGEDDALGGRFERSPPPLAAGYIESSPTEGLGSRTPARPVPPW